jgi:tetratricopeptide (TPR) repeat protein
MYLKYAEDVRPDVKLLEQGVHQLQQLKFNPRKEAVYCTHWQAAFNVPPSPAGPGLRLMPEGLIYRIVSTDMSYSPRDLWNHIEHAHLLPAMEDPNIPRNYLTRCLLGNVYFMRAEWELPRDARAAMAWYQRAARMAYDSAVQHFNLGLVYERMGCVELARDEFEIAARIDPTYTRADSRRQKAEGELQDRR